MSITYQLKALDFAAAARYMMDHHQVIRQQFIRTEVAAFCSAMAVVLVFSYLLFREQYVLTVLAGTVLVVGWFFFFRAYIRSSYIKRFTKISTNGDAQFLRNVSLQLSDKGISSTTDLGTGELFWSSIEKLDEDKTYIYLVLPSSNVMLIPKASFASPDAIAVFVQTLRERMPVR